MFEILIVTLILLMKIHERRYVFRMNDKIAVHCSFCTDSDEEIGEWPKPTKTEVRYGAPTLRFLNSNYIYANLPLCGLIAEAKGQEYSRPPEAQVFPTAGTLLLLLARL